MLGNYVNIKPTYYLFAITEVIVYPVAYVFKYVPIYQTVMKLSCVITMISGEGYVNRWTETIEQ